MSTNFFESLPDSAGSDGPAGNALKGDVDQLVKLAEELRARYEQTEQRVWWLRIIQSVMTVIIVATPIYYKVIPKSGFSFLYYDWKEVFERLFIFTFISLCMVGAVEVLIRRLRLNTEPDRKDLKEVVQMLREVEGSLFTKNNWSPFERVAFRIRLSRFDIG